MLPCGIIYYIVYYVEYKSRHIHKIVDDTLLGFTFLISSSKAFSRYLYLLMSLLKTCNQKVDGDIISKMTISVSVWGKKKKNRPVPSCLAQSL